MDTVDPPDEFSPGEPDAPRPGAAHRPDLPASLTGKLIISAPGAFDDENFRRTVVFLLEHSANGAIGVILNRPTDTRVEDVFPDWGDHCSSPSVLFEGGPVQDGMIIALGRLQPRGGPDRGWQPVVGETVDRIGTVDLRLPSWDLAPHLADVRVFAGYAGWSAGQLEHEMRMDGWHIARTEPGDVFHCTPAQIWADVLRRQGGGLAILAHYPTDVLAN